MGRALQSTWSSLSQILREKGRVFGKWVAAESLKLFVCYSCGHNVNILDRVCNQCGTGEPARLSRRFTIFLCVVGASLIITLLSMFAM
jgi:hypothetical protein